LRVLLAHNRYRIRGGEDEVVDSELALLGSHGHEVFPYIKDNHSISSRFPVKEGVQSTWNWEVYREVRTLIAKHKIELLHCHNLYPQLSPAIFHAAKTGGAATVQTLHNYKFGCPKGELFRNGSVCERCLGKTFAWPGVMRGCYRDSRAATAAIAIATTSHRLLSTWENRVDTYIALTDFARGKCIDAGLPADRITVKGNFVHDPGVGTGDGDFVLYVGRLTQVKGISVLLRAWTEQSTGLKLTIIGTGDLEPDVRAAAASDCTINFLGVQPLDTVLHVMGRAKALLFPSLWYEGMPRTIVESFAKGTPVVASDLGSMSSLIQHGVTGLHFPAGVGAAMMTQLQWIQTHPSEYAQMRRKCREKYEADFTPERNYGLLMEVYKRAISRDESGGQVHKAV
jgi:glycosyltransferase involved in cell wall biosynthesis